VSYQSLKERLGRDKKGCSGSKVTLLTTVLKWDRQGEGDGSGEIKQRKYGVSMQGDCG